MATQEAPALSSGQIHVQAIVTTADGRRLGGDIGVVVTDLPDEEFANDEFAMRVLEPALAACAQKIARVIA